MDGLQILKWTVFESRRCSNPKENGPLLLLNVVPSPLKLRLIQIFPIVQFQPFRSSSSILDLSFEISGPSPFADLSPSNTVKCDRPLSYIRTVRLNSFKTVHFDPGMSFLDFTNQKMFIFRPNSLWRCMSHTV